MKEAVVVFSGLHGEHYHPDAGGIQLAEYSFCEGAQQYGWNTMAIVGHNDSAPVTHDNADVHRIPTQPFQQGGYVDALPFALVAAAEVAKKSDHFDTVVHYTSLFPAMAFLNSPTHDYLKKTGKFKPPVIYTLHNYHYSIADQPKDIFEQYSEEWQFLHDSERLVVESVDTAVVTSDEYKGELTRKYGKAVLYLPNTMGERASYPVAHESIDEFDIALSLSRLDKGKQLEELLEIFAQASQDNPRLRLLMCGDGDERDALVTKAEGLGLDPIYDPTAIQQKKLRELMQDRKVTFTGRVRTQEKSAVLNLADCFVQLSMREVSPLVGLENMVYGNRILATDIPGWQDFVLRGADVHLTSLDKDVATEALIDAMSTAKKDRLSTQSKNFAVYDRFYDPSIVIPARLNLYEGLLR